MKEILKWIGAIVLVVAIRLIFEKIGISDWLNGFWCSLIFMFVFYKE